MLAPHYVTPTLRSQAIVEADEDEPRGGRVPGHVVLIGDVCRERDGDGLAHLIACFRQSSVIDRRS